jgi:hypothetical protein
MQKCIFEGFLEEKKYTWVEWGGENTKTESSGNF